MMDRRGHDGPSQTLQGIESLNSVTEEAGRTIVGTTNRHKLRNPRLGRIFVKCFKGRFGLFLLIIIKLVVEY